MMFIRMTLLRLPAAALATVALGASAAPSAPPEGVVAPAVTAVVVQSAAACKSPVGPRIPGAAKRLMGLGAQVVVVCGAADATAAVVRASSTHAAVLGTGPDVRAAMALAAADHPGVRFAPLR